MLAYFAGRALTQLGLHTVHMHPSKAEALTTGLNLMRLLVQNRIAEFHTELELLPAEARPRTQYCCTSLLRDLDPGRKHQLFTVWP